MFVLILVFFVIKREMASIKNNSYLTAMSDGCSSDGLGNGGVIDRIQSDTGPTVYVTDIECETIEVGTHGPSSADFVRDFDEGRSAMLTSEEIETAFVPDECKQSYNVRTADENEMTNVPQELDSLSTESGSEYEADVTCDMFTFNKDQINLYPMHTLPDQERETYNCDYCDKVYYKKGSLTDHVKQKPLFIVQSVVRDLRNPGNSPSMELYTQKNEILYVNYACGAIRENVC